MAINANASKLSMEGFRAGGMPHAWRGTRRGGGERRPVVDEYVVRKDVYVWFVWFVAGELST